MAHEYEGNMVNEFEAGGDVDITKHKKIMRVAAKIWAYAMIAETEDVENAELRRAAKMWAKSNLRRMGVDHLCIRTDAEAMHAAKSIAR